jgi:hypothetical protein
MFRPGIVISGHDKCAALKCPFPTDLQEKDSIPAEFMSGAQHYIARQNITDTVQAPWTSYYAMLRGAPITITNYGGVWFEVKRQENKFVAIRPA